MTGTSLVKAAGSLLAAGLLSATLVAQTAAAARYDNQIQTSVTEKLAKRLYGSQNAAIGQTIKIHGLQFTVIGTSMYSDDPFNPAPPSIWPVAAVAPSLVPLWAFVVESLVVSVVPFGRWSTV